MKSVFMKKVYKKIYYVGFSNFNNFITSNTDINEFIKYHPEFINYIKIFETDIFKNKFECNNKICIDNEILNIEEVVTDLSQENSYIYIVDKFEMIDDEESYNKAKKELEEKKKVVDKEKLEFAKKQVININRGKWFKELAEEFKKWC